MCLPVFSVKDRMYLTLEDIKCTDSDVYDVNWELFNRGVSILEKRLCDEDWSEFSDEEREVLEEIYILKNLHNILNES